MTITGDKFLRDLKRRITVPANQVLIDNDGFLEMADDVTRSRLVPVLMSVNQNFFVTKTTSEVVTDQAEYPIPYRAIGRGLRELKLGQTSDDTSIYDLSLIALEDAYMFGTSGRPCGFYFQGDKYVLTPAPADDSYVLHEWYDLQPSRLVQTTDAALVTGISDAVVTCSLVPSTMTAGVYVDFVQGRAGCSTLGMDVAISNVSGTQITFASADDVPSDFAVGDYIALAQETPVVQLPDEASPLLITVVAERVLYSIGDFDGSARLKEEAVQLEKDLKLILAPRVQGETTKIINRRGLLRGRGGVYWRQRGGYYP